MSLTFEDAKLRYNPDPDWWPTRDSQDYKQILELMRQSGHITLTERIGLAPKEIPYKEYLVKGQYKHPLTKHISEPAKPAVSKNRFLSVRSNRDAVINHIAGSMAPVQFMARAEIGEPPPLPTIPKTDKRMSKEEFLRLAGVREYVEHHILKNKK